MNGGAGRGLAPPATARTGAWRKGSVRDRFSNRHSDLNRSEIGGAGETGSVAGFVVPSRANGRNVRLQLPPTP